MSHPTTAVELSAALDDTLPVHLAEILTSYLPDGIGKQAWPAIRDAHREVMVRSGIVGHHTFTRQVKVVALYLAWRHTQGGSLARTDTLAFDLIDPWYLTGTNGRNESTRDDYRSQMRKLAEQANPSLAAAPQIKTLGHRSVRPGYPSSESGAIKRLA